MINSNFIHLKTYTHELVLVIVYNFMFYPLTSLYVDIKAFTKDLYTSYTHRSFTNKYMNKNNLTKSTLIYPHIHYPYYYCS